MVSAFYEYIHRTCSGDPVVIDLLGWVFILFVWYWSWSGLFLYTDLTGKPKWMSQYKIQQDAHQSIDQKKLWRAIKVVAFNTIVLHSIFFYPLHQASAIAGVRYGTRDIPGIFEVIKDLSGILLVEEVVFYYSHRLLHHPWFYKNIHKQHHEWTSPIGLIAVYAHPLEYITGNGMSIFLGPLVMQSHILTVWVWYFLAVTGTIVHHSGYHLPFMSSSEHHDFHHLKFVGNYGTLGLLDWLHGTDRLFEQRIESKRHRLLLSTTPMWKLYPDDKKTTSEQNGKKIK